jgi:hypothetical protein
VIELLLEAERALSMGRADRAEVLYEQVVASDPRNSIAVVGLARVALERADDAGALVLARRALAIDDQNVAAQRLVQRLEEVLQTRGEALPAPEVAPVAEVAAATQAAPAAAQAAPAAAQAAPVAAKATPFDGPDPVLGPADTTGSHPAAGLPAAPHTPVAVPARRSLLDRLRGR